MKYKKIIMGIVFLFLLVLTVNSALGIQKLYVVNETDDMIYQYNLMNPWDVSTAVFDYKLDTTGEMSKLNGVQVFENKLYAIGETTDEINEYNITNWDISTAVFNQVKVLSVITGWDVNSAEFFIGDNGNKLYMASRRTEDERIYELNLTTPYDISTITYYQSFDPKEDGCIDPVNIKLKNDGTKMFINHQFNLTFVYNLSTPWDISTRTLDFNNSMSNTDVDSYGLFVAEDEIYISDRAGGYIDYYDMTNWELSTAVFNQRTYFTGIEGFYFSPYNDIILIYPNDDSDFLINYITMKYNYTKELNGTNCSLYLNDILNQTNEITNISNEFDITDLDYGSYNWNVFCVDNTGMNITSKTRDFDITRGTLYVNATDMTDSSSISNFTILVNGTTYCNTTNGTAVCSNFTVGNYNITIDAEGYQLKSENLDVVFNDSIYNIAFELYTTNSFSMIFKDTETDLFINTTNISLEVFSDAYANNYSTENGTLYIDNLIDGEYVIRYNADDYTENFYFFNLLNRTHNNFTLYLLKNTSTYEFNILILDLKGNTIEGAIIKLLRQYIENNMPVMKLVSMTRKTDFSGNIKGYGTFNDEYYKFEVEFEGETNKITIPNYITSDSIIFNIDTEEIPLGDYDRFLNIDHDLSFNNNTNNFRFDYSSKDGTFSKICMKVYKIGIQNTLLNESCLSTSTGTILIGITPISGTSYIAKVYTTASPENYFASFTYSFFGDDPVLGGLFIVFILTLAFLFLSFYAPLSLILMPLPLLFGCIIGFVPIPIPSAVLFEVAGCIVGVLIYSSKGGF